MGCVAEPVVVVLSDVLGEEQAVCELRLQFDIACLVDVCADTVAVCRVSRLVLRAHDDGVDTAPALRFDGVPVRISAGHLVV